MNIYLQGTVWLECPLALKLTEQSWSPINQTNLPGRGVGQGLAQARQFCSVRDDSCDLSFKSHSKIAT